MTRIFFYEFVTGGGWWSVDSTNPPSGSLLNEALAMVRALAEDFSRLPGIEVSSLWDCRLPEKSAPAATIHRVRKAGDERERFSELAKWADYGLLIAPEFDGYLLSRVGWAEDLNCRLLSPGRSFVEIASNKHETAESLIRSSIPAPRGLLFSAGTSIPSWLEWPAILKPRDGAGSMDVQLVQSVKQLERLGQFNRVMRLERYCPGMAASVAVLCGPKGNTVLPAGRQILSDRDDFQYLGGELPLDVELCQRAGELARRVMTVFPKTRGYVGIDLVFGAEPDGTQDFVIEVNPRLTTSYVGLRQICRQNLAGAMLAIARGETVELTFESRSVRFEVNG